MSKLAWRRAWFQVHKWIGLLLAVLIIPISVSGSALVWHDALDRLVNPARFATTGETLLAPAAYVQAARGAIAPGDRVAQLTMPQEDGPVVVAAERAPAPGAAPGGRAERTMVYLDPPTAEVLDVASSRAGLVRFLHVLHGSLQVPGVGRQIVGWIGVAMMLSAFTGLWLWWPTVGKWVRGLRWRRHRNTDTNLHYLMGFWVALPLFVLSLTGAWISFPQFFAGLVGQGQRAPGPDRAAKGRARPLERPAHGVDAVVARAGAVAQGRLRSVAWPTDRKPEWTVTIAPQAEGGEQRRTVSVADVTGIAVATPTAERGGVARLMRRIHDGTDMGIVWQVIIFAGGILPAVLAVTGIVMWWRARGWKADLAARQRVRRAEMVPAE